MNTFTIKQLKDAMIDLYPKQDKTSCIAYRMAFDLLESKISDSEMDQFLDAYGL